MDTDPIAESKSRQRETWAMGNSGDDVIRHGFLLTLAIKARQDYQGTNFS